MPENLGRRPSVLIMGYRSTGRAVEHAGGDALSEVAADPPKCADCRILLLPDDPDDALLKAIERMDHDLPDAVVIVGALEGGRGLRVERIAVNAGVGRDAAGLGGPGAAPGAGGSRNGGPLSTAGGESWRGQSQPIDAAGPSGYFSTLPVDAMVSRVAAGGVPASVSPAPDACACNRIHYALLHYIALRGRETWFGRRPPAGLSSRVGCIHVAQVPGKTPVPALGPSLTGLRLAIEVVVEQLASSGAASPEPCPVLE